MIKFAYLAATLGPIGYIKHGPGTFGSLAALLLIPVLQLGWFYGAITMVAVLALGIWVSGKVSKDLGQHDPSFVVIDEVCGIVTSFLFVPIHSYSVIAGFLLFRVFDIVKPKPIRSFERLPGGFGIVLDDVMAGVYTNLILQILFRYA